MTQSSFRTAVEEILGVPAGSLRDEDTRDTVENWSSVADVQIFSLISSEFGVETDADLIEAETVGDLVRVLDEKGAFRA